ncbi:hypothetical protein LTS12_028254 [Elasticomyces elasticus]|nr:hypothetical protein LTS12_028254 [Elasticomyces elasticus]
MNLTYLTTAKEFNQRQVRWFEGIVTSNICISYGKGSEKDSADMLRRRTDYIKGGTKQRQAILQQDEEGTMTVNRIAATSTDDFYDGFWRNFEKDATAKTVHDDPAGHTKYEEMKDGREVDESCLQRFESGLPVTQFVFGILAIMSLRR